MADQGTPTTDSIFTNGRGATGRRIVVNQLFLTAALRQVESHNVRVKTSRLSSARDALLKLPPSSGGTGTGTGSQVSPVTSMSVMANQGANTTRISSIAGSDVSGGRRVVVNQLFLKAALRQVKSHNKRVESNALSNTRDTLRKLPISTFASRGHIVTDAGAAAGTTIATSLAGNKPRPKVSVFANAIAESSSTSNPTCSTISSNSSARGRRIVPGQQQQQQRQTGRRRAVVNRSFLNAALRQVETHNIRVENTAIWNARDALRKLAPSSPSDTGATQHVTAAAAVAIATTIALPSSSSAGTSTTTELLTTPSGDYMAERSTLKRRRSSDSDQCNSHSQMNDSSSGTHTPRRAGERSSQSIRGNRFHESQEDHENKNTKKRTRRKPLRADNKSHKSHNSHKSQTPLRDNSHKKATAGCGKNKRRRTASLPGNRSGGSDGSGDVGSDDVSTRSSASERSSICRSRSKESLKRHHSSHRKEKKKRNEKKKENKRTKQRRKELRYDMKSN